VKVLHCISKSLKRRTAHSSRENWHILKTINYLPTVSTTMNWNLGRFKI
jgi:hypothetical protein